MNQWQGPVSEEQWVQILVILAIAFLVLRRLPIVISGPVLVLAMAAVFPQDWLLQIVAGPLERIVLALLPLGIVCLGLWIIVRKGPLRW